MIDGYTLSSRYEDMDFNRVHEFISSSYWAKNIPKSTLETAMKNSLCFGVFSKEKCQVGFARVITDKATYAYLADVFIAEEHRGKGLSKWLVKFIQSHPQLQELRRFALVTRDAQPLYQKFGFASLAHPEWSMEIFRPEIYSGFADKSI